MTSYCVHCGKQMTYIVQVTSRVRIYCGARCTAKAYAMRQRERERAFNRIQKDK